MYPAHRAASYRKRSPTTLCRSFAVDSASNMQPESAVLLRRTLTVGLFFATVSLFCLVLLRDVDSSRFLSRFPSSYSLSSFPIIIPSAYDFYAVSSFASCSSSFELLWNLIICFYYRECSCASCCFNPVLIAIFTLIHFGISVNSEDCHLSTVLNCSVPLSD